MHTCPTVLALTLTLALAACTVAPPRESEPFGLAARHAVDYRAEVVAGHSGLTNEVERPDGRVTDDRIVGVRWRLLLLGEPEARQLGLLSVGAWTVDAAQVDARFESAGWRARAPETTLVLHPGQVDSSTVLDQRAYVRSFDVTAADGVLIADPVVDVLSEGTLLLVEAEELLESESMRLGLTLHLSDLQGLDRVEARVPGGSSPVTLQRPIVSQQRLATEAVLARGECLLVVALAPKSTGRVLAFLDRVELEQAR